MEIDFKYFASLHCCLCKDNMSGSYAPSLPCLLKPFPIGLLKPFPIGLLKPFHIGSWAFHLLPWLVCTGRPMSIYLSIYQFFYTLLWYICIQRETKIDLSNYLSIHQIFYVILFIYSERDQDLYLCDLGCGFRGSYAQVRVHIRITYICIYVYVCPYVCDLGCGFRGSYAYAYT